MNSLSLSLTSSAVVGSGMSVESVSTTARSSEGRSEKKVLLLALESLPPASVSTSLMLSLCPSTAVTLAGESPGGGSLAPTCSDSGGLSFTPALCTSPSEDDTGTNGAVDEIELAEDWLDGDDARGRVGIAVSVIVDTTSVGGSSDGTWMDGVAGVPFGDLVEILAGDEGNSVASVDVAVIFSV